MPSSNLETVTALIDKANGEDPNLVLIAGDHMPAELAYGQRMAQLLAEFDTEASEFLKIAVRAQHLERWKTPRASYPQGRAGYLRWRSDQKRFHGERVSALMVEAGYGEADCDRVAALVRKEGLRTNPETQTLEDVACLVFLKFYAVEFAAPHDASKVVDVLAKTLKKMSPRAIAATEQYAPDGQLLALIAEAKKSGVLDDRQE